MKVVSIIGLSLLITSSPAFSSWASRAIVGLKSFFAPFERPFWTSVEFGHKASLALSEEQFKECSNVKDQEGNSWSCQGERAQCVTPRGTEYTRSMTVIGDSVSKYTVQHVLLMKRNGRLVELERHKNTGLSKSELDNILSVYGAACATITEEVECKEGELTSY